jgi:hypothetical protein
LEQKGTTGNGSSKEEYILKMSAKSVLSNKGNAVYLYGKGVGAVVAVGIKDALQNIRKPLPHFTPN